MMLLCIWLIFISACMHAGWNLICKSRSPSAAFFLIATTASITAMIPIYLYFMPVIIRIPPAVWILLVVTGAVQACYYISLGNAYRLNEISIAYPMARSLPVMLVPIFTTILCMGHPLGVIAIGGMLLISAGCIVLPLRAFSNLKVSAYLGKGFFFIIGAGISVTGYSIIDSEALKLLNAAEITGSHIHSALIYIALENVFIELFLIPYVMGHRGERETFWRIKRTSLRYPAISGVICTAGYTLVLGAMMLVTNVSYVVAFRQISIFLGAILGIIIFKEKLTVPKAVGLGLIFAGLVLIALF